MCLSGPNCCLLAPPCGLMLPGEPRGRLVSAYCSHEVLHPGQVVNRCGEGEHPPAPLDSLVPILAHEAHTFQPAEDLFDKLPFVLADAVARVAYRTAIDRTGTPVGDVLCDVRGDAAGRTNTVN